MIDFIIKYKAYILTLMFLCIPFYGNTTLKPTVWFAFAITTFIIHIFNKKYNKQHNYLLYFFLYTTIGVCIELSDVYATFVVTVYMTICYFIYKTFFKWIKGDYSKPKTKEEIEQSYKDTTIKSVELINAKYKNKHGFLTTLTASAIGDKLAGFPGALLATHLVDLDNDKILVSITVNITYLSGKSRIMKLKPGTYMFDYVMQYLN